MVNKTLKGFVEPDLYANMQWMSVSNRQATSIALFIRTIVRRPQLGHHVRTLTLMGVSPSPRSRNHDHLTPSILDQEDLSKCVVNELLHVQVTSAKTWIELLQAGNMDAMVALLIAHVPNLTSLHLGPSFTTNNACFGLLLRSALCEPITHNLPTFTHLRTLNFNAGRFSHSTLSMRHQNAPNVLLFFYLPSIERIRISFDCPGDFTWPSPRCEAPLSHTLRELDLGCPFRAAYLGNTLSVTRNLKSLRWDWHHGGVTSPFGDDGVIDLGQIAAALSIVQETLEQLIITARCTFGANKQFPHCTSRGSLQLLAAFPSIKTLKVPIAFLMGWTRDEQHWNLWDVIPKTVESVIIMDDLWYHNRSYIWTEKAIFDVIKTRLSTPERLPPHLRHLQLISKTRTGLDLGPVGDELKALGSQRGINVDIQRQRRTCSLKWSQRAV